MLERSWRLCLLASDQLDGCDLADITGADTNPRNSARCDHHPAGDRLYVAEVRSPDLSGKWYVLSQPRNETPRFVQPMAPTPVSTAREAREQWLVEPKVDGYRALILKKAYSVQILSNNNDLTRSYPKTPEPLL